MGFETEKQITQAMFLGIVARPRTDMNNHTNFDRKIGVYPVATHKVPGQRNNRYGVVGTQKTKLVDVIREGYKKMPLEKVIPVLNQMWPLRKEPDLLAT